jgi:hypothetical protein
MKRSLGRMLMMKKKSRLMFIVTRLVMKKIMSAEASGKLWHRISARSA